MTRAFDDSERNLVTEALLDAGEELFGRTGFAKTAVEEITQEAGVAKGTFYSFWPSKETFFFACLERAELRFQEEVVTPALTGAGHPADSLGRIIQGTLKRVDDYPLIKTAMDLDLIRRLTRKLPKETLDEHRRTDRKELKDIASSWDPGEFDPGIAPEVLDGILKGLMMMSLHKEIIGEDVYEEVGRTTAEIMSAGLKAISDERILRKNGEGGKR